MTTSHDQQDARGKAPRRVFVPNVRVMEQGAQSELSDKEKAFARECRDRGVWLELFCPDDSCLSEAERIQIPVFCETPGEGRKLWLELFCPESRCEIHAPTHLP